MLRREFTSTIAFVVAAVPVRTAAIGAASRTADGRGGLGRRRWAVGDRGIGDGGPAARRRRGRRRARRRGSGRAATLPTTPPPATPAPARPAGRSRRPGRSARGSRTRDDRRREAHADGQLLVVAVEPEVERRASPAAAGAVGSAIACDKSAIDTRAPPPSPPARSARRRRTPARSSPAGARPERGTRSSGRALSSPAALSLRITSKGRGCACSWPSLTSFCSGRTGAVARAAGVALYSRTVLRTA